MIMMAFIVITITMKAQTPIVKYLPVAYGISSVWQSTQGGYMAVGNDVNNLFFTHFGLDNTGDTVWTKQHPTYFPMTNRWPVCGAGASDGGCFILWGAREWVGGGDYCSYNAVMRTNARGDSTWNVIISSESAWSGANLNNLIATPDGGCVVVGESADHGSFRIVKIDDSGKISWDNLIPGDCYPTYQSVCVSSDGGYIATGYNNGCADGVLNLMAAKFDNSGSNVWSKIFHSGAFNVGDSKKSQAFSVVPTSDGGCLLSGFVSDSGSYGGSALLMRLNALGDSLWTKHYYHSTVQQPIAYKLVALSSGQYLMYLAQNAGYTNAGATLVKLDESGNMLWHQTGYSYMLSMSGVDQDGGILLVGYWPAIFIRTTAGGLYTSPQLMSPGNNNTDVMQRPQLIWSGGPQFISSFHAQVATDSLFTTIVFDSTNVANDTIYTNQLQPVTKYFWRVQSYGNEGGPTQWSDLWWFTTSSSMDVNEVSNSYIHIYPNPATRYITIDSPQQALIEISNMQGQLIKILSVNGKTNVDISALPSGVYVMKMKTEKGFAMKRFVKK